MDYAAVAAQFGGRAKQSPSDIDYAALAQDFGGRPKSPESQVDTKELKQTIENFENPTEGIGVLESIGEQITGERRSTPATEQFPEWIKLPEINQLNMGTLKTILGTLATGPKETVQIIKANFPEVNVRQDSKGNYILRSKIDNQEYAIPPGLTPSDIARGIGTFFTFLPAAKATKVATAGAAGAGTQAAHEAIQKGVGGEFSVPDILAAGALGTAGPIFEQYATKIAPAFRWLLGKKTMPQAKPEAPRIPVTEDEATLFGQMGELIKEATGKGKKADLAKAKLAELTRINPEAQAAAERLGLDLPFDVLSDNPQMRSAVGLTRSVAGSEAEALWTKQLGASIDQADEALKRFDANFVEGRPSTAAVSDRVFSELESTKNALGQEATENYNIVDEFVPKNTPIEFNNLKALLQQTEEEVGAKSMTVAERHLLSVVDEPRPTYGALKREKSLIGKALSGKASPFESLDEGTLKRLYGALAQDQLDNVERLAPPEIVRNLKGANLLTAKKKDVEKRMISGYGKEIQGSISTLMTTALKTGAKGDSAAFNKLMKIVPDDLRKETISTALASAASSQRAGQAGFGFNEFTKLYQGLRSNPGIFAQIKKSLGPNSGQVMEDLYTISKRMNDVRARVLGTGKANQALVQSLEALPMMDRIMRTATAQRATAAVVGGLGGPAGSAVIPDVVQYMASSQKEPVRAAGKLFASQAFADLAIKAAKGTVDDAALEAVVKGAPFRRFARGVKLPEGLRPQINWLRSISQTTIPVPEEDTIQ